MSGWICLHRSIVDWEWYDDANTMRLHIHCLLKANHTPKVWRNIDIRRGSFYTSLDTLSSELGLSVRQIRVSLDKLVRTGSVTSSQMARGRMITVVHYESYQGDDRLNVSEMAGKRQGSDRVVTTTNNDNNDNKNITVPSAPVCPHQEIINIYHEKLPELPAVKVSLWGGARESNLRSRWKQSEKHQSLDFWSWYFDKVAGSDFLTGRSNGFRADLGWLIKAENFRKVIEGNYANR